METIRVLRIRLFRHLRISGLSSRRRQLFYFLLGAVFIWFLLKFSKTSENDFVFTAEDEEYIQSIRDPNIKADKWVVITTIRSPTDAVRALAEQADWKLVVVGDKKTPFSWRLPVLPNVVYLDVKAHKALGYHVHYHLPYNSYSRKTIGYLYAIEHGAKYIYETDDDNYPTYGLAGFHSTPDTVTRLVLSTTNLTNNPYVHFGQSTLWPRGYPLDRVGLAADRRYNLCEVQAPSIQQGVVNGDPDVDALFRLTRRQSTTPLQLTFDRSAPPFVLPPRTYAPFNSQNTFFGSRALWALVLPVKSVPDRATDIYRAYWAQRLLWLVGDTVSFAPPNAVQTRNQHLDLIDARDEQGLYQEMSRYVETLDKWQCGHGAVSFFDCVSQLSRHLVSEGLWMSSDADIVDAWLSDLTALGYKPPRLSSNPLTPICKSEHSGGNRIVFYPVEQNTTMPHSKKLHVPPDSTNHELVMTSIEKACGPIYRNYWQTSLSVAQKFSNILLVISVPGNIRLVLPFFEALYRPNFPNIIYCIQNKVADDYIDRWKISVVRLAEDVSALPCILAAGAMQYGVHGYLHVSASMFFTANSKQMSNRLDNLMWMPGEFDAYQQSTLKLCYHKQVMCRPMSRDVLKTITRLIDKTSMLFDREKTKLRQCISKMERDPSWVGRRDSLWVSDLALFLPAKYVQRLALMREILTSENDLLVVLMLECELPTVNYLKRSEEFGVVGDDAPGELNSHIDYYLPFPFSKIASESNVAKTYCSHFDQFK